MILYREPQTIFGRVLLGFFMAGTVFFILFTMPPVTTYFTGISGGLFLGLFLSISISAMGSWSSFYMMCFVMGVSATIALGFSYLANSCDEMDKTKNIEREKWTALKKEVGCTKETCVIHVRTF
jgi:ABC-type Fe3+-siderophore transport system permease subunit